MAGLYRFAGNLLALMPTFAGRIFDHFLAILLQYIIRYRSKLVRQQIAACFPKHSKASNSRIISKFYLHLANTLRLSLAGLHWPEKKVLNHIKVTNPEVIANLLATNKPIILVGAHQGNWELAATRLALEWDFPMTAIYKPVKQQALNQYLKSQRSRFGLDLIPIRHTARGFLKSKDRSVLFLLLGDQSPDNMKEALWINFMGRETAWLHGLERYSHLADAAVVFFCTTPVGHDRFEIHLELLTNQISTLDRGRITTIYIKALESSIYKTPWNWLWSHNRWKRKKEHQTT